MSKVAKGKRRTRGKDGKTGKGAEEQDNESTYSFQSYDSKWLFMFLYQGWYLHEEKEISFLTACLANFSSTGTSSIEILTPAWSSASASHFHKGIFFFSWQNGTLSSLGLLSVFFPWDFLQLLIFPWAKIFSKNKELSRVNFVKSVM